MVREVVTGLDTIEITVDLDKSSCGGLLGAVRLAYTEEGLGLGEGDLA